MTKLTSLAALLLPATLSAQNPIAQTSFSPDPAPMVHNDTLFVFTGRDEEKADFFWMNDWRLFSTTDMVNWTDHGSPLRQCDFKWADDRAWASQCIERNNKFYWYVCAHSRISRGMAIGVAVADNITGPYRDALGKPLYEDGKWDHIDPTVFIDRDNQAYLYWGNPRLYSVKLNEDMISFADEVKCDTTVQRYTEGPWIFRQRDNMDINDANVKKAKKGKKSKGKKDELWGKYILTYAAGGVPECLAYSVSDSPQGPWKYMGEVMAQSDFTNSFTNHGGNITYKGKDYLFYHTGWLPGGGGFGRSASVDEFTWNEDGSFPLVKPTKEGVEPVGTLDPYNRVEAETMAFSKGIHSDWNTKEKRVYISDIHNGDWTCLRNVDLNSGPLTVEVSAASALQGGNIEFHLDKADGPVLATVKVEPTGGWEEWQTFSANVNGDFGDIHDVYIIFKGLKGCKLFNLDWWQFKH